MRKDISKKQLREFGILIGLVFPTFIGWLLPAVLGHAFRFWTLWIGVPSLILGILKPRILFYPYKGWMLLGRSLGWVNSRIILGLVFLLVLQPIAMIMRIFSYDPLRKIKSNDKSYRENKKGYKVDLKRIF
tara:strand:+ start:3421 stop:3813 length:393 start_codon:yes stop_codon:yes gene_type:complete